MSIIRKYGLLALVVVVIAGIIVAVATAGTWAKATMAQGTTSVAAVQQPTPSTTPSASASACAATWPMVAGNYGDLNRWFNDGVAAIRNAKTATEAREAINTWLNGVKQDPVLLSGASRIFLNKEVVTNDLQKEGCATQKAVDVAIDLAVLMGKSSMTPGQAPDSGYNTGVDNNQVVVSAFAGVYGDTTAIEITLPDGTKVWIMARCGNPVVSARPGLPPGKTDNPPTPTPTPTPTCVEIPDNGVVDCGASKEPTAGAGARGNVPTIGQGVNPPPPAQPSAPAVTQAPTAVGTTQAPPPVIVPSTASVTPSTRTTTPPPPPPSATVTATYAPSCPNADNPACG